MKSEPLRKALEEHGFDAVLDAARGADTLQLGAAYAANPEWLRRELTIGLGLQRQQTLEGPAWGAELRIQMRW